MKLTRKTCIAMLGMMVLTTLEHVSGCLVVQQPLRRSCMSHLPHIARGPRINSRCNSNCIQKLQRTPTFASPMDRFFDNFESIFADPFNTMEDMRVEPNQNVREKRTGGQQDLKKSATDNMDQWEKEKLDEWERGHERRKQIWEKGENIRKQNWLWDLQQERDRQFDEVVYNGRRQQNDMVNPYWEETSFSPKRYDSDYIDDGDISGSVESPLQNVLRLDIPGYRPTEVSITTHGRHILIKGRHECGCNEGCLITEFERTYELPTGYDPRTIKAILSKEGILSITGIKQTNQIETSDSTRIPIDGMGFTNEDISTVECADRKASININKLDKTTGRIYRNPHQAVFKKQTNVEDDSDDVTIEVVE